MDRTCAEEQRLRLKAEAEAAYLGAKLAVVERAAQGWSDSRTGWACREDIDRILHPNEDD